MRAKHTTYTVTATFERSLIDDLPIARDAFPGLSDETALRRQLARELQSACDHVDVGLAGTFQVGAVALEDGRGERSMATNVYYTITIRPDDISYRVEAEPETIPVRGNALASGDAALDREAEGEILRRVESGDVWAWAAVRVVAEWRGCEESAYLGACSYTSEADFRAGGYFADMAVEARGRLLQRLGASLCLS